MHARINGIDDVTGLPYRADDPALLLWVHVAMVESIVTIVQRYGRGLDDVDADRYVAETVPFAEVVGVPAEQVPTTVAGLREFITSVPCFRRRRRQRKPWLWCSTRPSLTPSCGTCGGISDRSR